jgi:hypothetical protein
MAKSKDVHAATPMLPEAVLDVIIFINPSVESITTRCDLLFKK